MPAQAATILVILRNFIIGSLSGLRINAGGAGPVLRFLWHRRRVNDLRMMTAIGGEFGIVQMNLV